MQDWIELHLPGQNITRAVVRSAIAIRRDRAKVDAAEAVKIFGTWTKTKAMAERLAKHVGLETAKELAEMPEEERAEVLAQLAEVADAKEAGPGAPKS